MKIRITTLFLFLMCLLLKVNGQLNPEVYSSLKFRHIGPDGNRVIAIAGHSDHPNLIYAGAASGGIWKTEDAGLSWKPIFDDQEVSSVGALAIAQLDPNIIWAGTGETNIRSNISIGNGIYRSNDRGKSWEKMGLERTGRIGRIVIDPDNSDIVLAAAMGTSHGPQQERGVYRTDDGGKTWERVLFTDENTGASDIAMDPSNPKNLVAGMWPLDIKTWQRKSGGITGGLYRSVDGGKNWQKCTEGLPKGPTGKIAVAYAPSNPDQIYALIETDQYKFEGVLWGSKDGGNSWELISYDQQYHTRPHYYSRLAVSPHDEQEIWFLASRMVVSKDGGQSGTIKLSGGHDVHDIWFDPLNSDRILVAHDGGVRISNNHGESWYHPDLPVAQMYHVSVDDQVPYFVYGNRQDGTTYRIPSRGTEGAMKMGIGGGEVGFTVPDHFDNTIVWSSNEQGVITKHDLSSGITTNIQVWPETPVGQSPRDIKYRWVWSHPWVLSTHQKNTLYAGSQYVHKTTDSGVSWEVISPDLTTNDTSLQVHSGGLTYDNVGVDYGTSLYALDESPLNEKVIWAGSNDGLIHVTRDGGEHWDLVSKNIKGLPPLGTISSIDASTHEEGTAYVTIDFHQVDNRDPHVYKTYDFGKSWQKIVTGIPVNTFSYAQIIREDPVRKGMLYLGTENCLYFTLDDGESWLSLKNNLPPAPVRWLAVQENFGDLVLSTYGRGFWILDDLSALRQIDNQILSSGAHLFRPRQAYRFKNRWRLLDGMLSEFYEDAVEGLAINYYLDQPAESPVKISIMNVEGVLVKELEGTKTAGINRIYWDLKHEDSPEVELRTPPLGYPELEKSPVSAKYNDKGWRELIVEGTGPNGPMVAPGTYTVKLEIGETVDKQDFEVLKDPKSKASIADIEEQVNLSLKIRDLATELVNMGNSIERIRKQLDDLQDDLNGDLMTESEIIDQKFINVEQNLFILRTTGASENGLRFPQKLFSHIKMLGYYVSSGDMKPTQSKYELFEELVERLGRHQVQYQQLIEVDLKDFNKKLKKNNLTPINK